MTDSLLKRTSSLSAAQPWLLSPAWDTLLILSPAFIATAIALLFYQQFNASQLPLWFWVVFILAIDVAHVYATLFRTYFNETAFQKQKTLFLVIPAACWIIGSLFYAIDPLLFWKALAYLAIFHFIRQQYGFICLYSRKEPAQWQKYAGLDRLCIYAATVYPLLFWHTHLPRSFNWFVEGDLFEQLPQLVSDIGLVFYVLIASAYVSKELYQLKATGYLNVPKNLIIAGTALSWWVGIVALNSDMAFTVTNVVTHGIPYMALIWLYHRQSKNSFKEGILEAKSQTTPPLRRFINFALSCAPVFFITLLGLAYLEEGLWDGFIWQEHRTFFAPWSLLPSVQDRSFLALLVPLLSLPQSTHYVLDGFIWRVKDKSTQWSA